MNLDNKQIETLKHIARSAGEILMKYYKQDITISTKTDFTPVTIADTLSNDYIVEQLKKSFPDFGILSEEGPHDWKDFTFTVDPLAGTKNFINGIDKFNVMLGILNKGEAVFGIVYDPVRNTMWFGGKDYGCFFQNIEGVHEVKIKKIEESILVTKKAYANEYPEFPKKYFVEDGPFTRGDLYIANSDGNIRILPKGEYFTWDYVPAQAILLGAGGVVLNMDGTEFIFPKDEIFKGSTISVDSIDRFNNINKNLWQNL